MAWSDATSPLYEDTQLGKPALRIWELDANSTRYDRQRAAPSDDDMHSVWIVWSTFFWAFSIFNIIVLLGILTAKKVRKRPFNIYLIYLMIPDIVYTLSCAIQCATLAAYGGFMTPGTCQAQSFYLIFGLTANSWMNAVIAAELRRLLTWSNKRRRYRPPSTKEITTRSLLVYLFSIALSMAGWIGADWWPHRTDLQNGLVCLPMEFDLVSSLIFWLVFFPVMSAIPIAYCFFVAFDVWRRKLLPPPGRRRELMIYFYRITAIFAVMWLPGVFFFYVSFVFPKVNVWAIYISSVWSHAQGAVAAAASMMKSDVYGGVVDLVTCRCNVEEPDEVETTQEQPRRRRSALVSTESSQSHQTVSSWMTQSRRTSWFPTMQSSAVLAGCDDFGDDFSQGSIIEEDDDDEEGMVMMVNQSNDNKNQEDIVLDMISEGIYNSNGEFSASPPPPKEGGEQQELVPPLVPSRSTMIMHADATSIALSSCDASEHHDDEDDHDSSELLAS